MDRERTHRGEKERIAERRNKAVELRKSGLPYTKIAEQLGVSLSTSYKDVAAVMAELKSHGLHLVMEMRQMELERLDAALLKVNQAMAAARQNKDHELVLKCVDRLVKIGESRRKLLGLDTPQRIDVTSGGEQIQKRIEIVDAATGSIIGEQPDQDEVEDQDDDHDA
ncbi:MAG: hypothetical protein AAGI37_15540 [Planctomycetota bacterium]